VNRRPHRVLGLLLLLLLALPAGARAQSEFLLGGSWSPGVPTGDLADFTGEASWRGVAFDLRMFRGPRTTLGLRVGWTVFDDEESGTRELPGENATITGTAFAYANVYPVHLTGHLYTGSLSETRLAVGLGLGVYPMTRRLEVSTFRVDETTWHPGGYPEIALLVPLRSVTLHLSAKFHYGFGLSDDPSVSWVGLDVGLFDL